MDPLGSLTPLSSPPGQLDQAARIQQRLIQKFPDDYLLRNHLATVFMTYNQNEAAKEVLNEVMIGWGEWGSTVFITWNEATRKR